MPKVAPKKRRSGPEMAAFTLPEPSKRWWAAGLASRSKIADAGALIVIRAAAVLGKSTGSISARWELISAQKQSLVFHTR